MAKFFQESEIDPGIITSQRVAILGYGNQGHAHALNLRDSGVEIRVGLHQGSRSREKAELAGFCVFDVSEATQWADVVVFCTPDVPMRVIYRDHVEPYLRDGQTLMFAHGFNIRYGFISPPANIAVAMVSPKGPGFRLRQEYERGSGLAALIAVHQDPRSDALALALSYAGGIGSARIGLIETTFKEETETDLFGEQAVLCGGLPELIGAGFSTLVEAGYQPEVAYFECVHEVKLIVDLLYAGGLAYMRNAISDTAEWGGYVAGPQVVNESSREAMRGLLQSIQDGSFAAELVAEDEAGRSRMNRFRQATLSDPVETTRNRLRQSMPKLPTE